MMAHNALGIYKKVDAFIAPSRFMVSQMEQYFKPARGRIVHIPSFVDQALLDARPGQASAGDHQISNGVGKRPYILQFGRVSSDKGVAITLRAYAGLERDVDLVIAGESSNDYRLRMEELALSLGETGVRFTGFVQGEALSSLIAGALCVVAPSTCHDNAPMSVYESLAYGKAVIGSDLGGISEQLEHGCGLLIPPGDAEALRHSLRQVIDDPLLRASLERAGQQRALNEYAPERHYARLLEVFQNVCAGERRLGTHARDRLITHK
jgi:glycosyltransferase involved in cell wall biosynthesis